MTADVAQVQPDLLQLNPLLNFDKTKKQQGTSYHSNGDDPEKTTENRKKAHLVGDEAEKSLFGLDFLEAVIDLLSSKIVVQSEPIQTFVKDWHTRTNRDVYDSELAATAIQLLFGELGVTNAMQFIQPFINGQGDYTKERDESIDEQTIDEIYAEILEMREIEPQPA